MAKEGEERGNRREMELQNQVGAEVFICWGSVGLVSEIEGLTLREQWCLVKDTSHE